MIHRALIITSMALLGLTTNVAAEKNTNSSPAFNEQLATELGADEYGMKMYVMAFLKAGPNRDQSKQEAAELQTAHMANIRRMAENGDLVLAGPFAANEQGMQGIYIFNVTTVEEAAELTKTDPAIKAGRLKMELIPWYGSAAVMQINQIHPTLAKQGM